MKTIIFSDIHLRYKYIDEILKQESSYDKVIYTGDFFDQFGDTPAQNYEAALWVKEKLNDTKNVLIFGNHDHSYRWAGNNHAYCSGFEGIKSLAINNALTQEDWNKFKLYHIQDGVIFSHAGLDRDWFYFAAKSGFDVPIQLTFENISKWLEEVSEDIKIRFAAGRSHPLMNAGRTRGGDQKCGGIIWQDFGDHIPISQLQQIVGHTPQNHNDGPLFRFANKDDVPPFRRAHKGVNPRWLKYGWTLCMDTNSRHYAVIENDILSIKSVTWMRESGNIDYTVTVGSSICDINLKEDKNGS